jgi:hypothetical protein
MPKTLRTFSLKMLALVASIFFVLGVETTVAQSQSVSQPDVTATKDGKAVSTWIKLEYNFSLGL